jgi:hypothetical protein
MATVVAFQQYNIRDNEGGIGECGRERRSHTLWQDVEQGPSWNAWWRCWGRCGAC